MRNRTSTKGHRAVVRVATVAGLVITPGAAFCAGLPGRVLDEVTVTAVRAGEQMAQADSASQGTASGEQLETRPILRVGEVLEVIPGLTVTQHSGSGKANQFFLRGFNLDHGTDFAMRVEGMPVNMPTHAHGQGYSDLNFMIPELVSQIGYKKGTYYADEGDFSAAGAADVTYKRSLDQRLVLLTGGEHSYGRTLLAASPHLAGGDWLFAVDSSYADGPWALRENFRKFSGVAKYSRGDADEGLSLELMGYDGRWRSTDQIPLRAVESGVIDRFDAIDPTDGGNSRRYSVSGSHWRKLGKGQLRASAYGIDYDVDLFSNFTYAIDEINGDQFEQAESRRALGGDLRYEQPLALLGRTGTFDSGVQLRHDRVSPVGLYRTQARRRFSTVREDQVVETSYGVYVNQSLQWTKWLRSVTGVRFDEFRFDVDSSLAPNSGATNDHIASPKLTLVLGPWARSELFLNWGRGFHSNDARGTTIRVSPEDGVTPAERVTALARATGAEVGARTAILPHAQLSASLWTLKLDSELLFIGDAGTTEPSRPSRRTGLELSAYYTPTASIILDVDLAWTHARFTDFSEDGDRIPNAVERVISAGLSYKSPSGWFGGARLRHLGPAALIEDDSARSKSTTLMNLDVGYHFSDNLSASVMLLNVLDEKANDITYYYESKLPHEAEPVNGIHFHPIEPRQLRVTLTARF